MPRNGNGHKQYDPSIIGGGLPQGLLGSYNGVPQSQNIEKIYEIPEACHMANKVIRGVYDRKLGNSLIRLAHRH